MNYQNNREQKHDKGKKNCKMLKENMYRMTLFLKHFHDAINPNKVQASFIARNGVFSKLKLQLKPILMKNIEEGVFFVGGGGGGGVVLQNKLNNHILEISKVKKTYSKKTFSLNKTVRKWPKMP